MHPHAYAEYWEINSGYLINPSILFSNSLGKQSMRFQPESEAKKSEKDIYI